MSKRWTYKRIHKKSRIQVWTPARNCKFNRGKFPTIYNPIETKRGFLYQQTYFHTTLLLGFGLLKFWSDPSSCHVQYLSTVKLRLHSSLNALNCSVSRYFSIFLSFINTRFEESNSWHDKEPQNFANGSVWPCTKKKDKPWVFVNNNIKLVVKGHYTFTKCLPSRLLYDLR